MVYYKQASKPVINIPKENPVLNLHNASLIPVKGYEGIYQVSAEGYVSNSRGVMKTYTNNNGYTCLKLVKEGVRTSVLLHRVVAEHFLLNPDNKPEVNHEDGNKANCAASNLSWMTSAENKAHAKANGLWSYNKPSTGIKIGNSSQFHNVIWDKARNKWMGVVRHNSKNHFQKRFDTELEAAKHVNWILDELGLKDRARNDV